MSEPGLAAGDRRIALTLLLTSAGVILWEVLLTRIYSVILYYHFAFMAVSVAMFGLTAGAVLVLLRVGPFAPRNLELGLARLALAGGLGMAAAITAQLSLPLQFQGYSVPGAYLLATYLLSAAPFVPAGACICLCLTRYRRVGMLYAADLAGAGLGCAAFPLLIPPLGGPGAVLLAGALLCAAAAVAAGHRGGATARGAWVATAVLVLVATANVSGQWLRVRWRHDGAVPTPLLERWNAFSRIMVTPYDDPLPFGWGIDPEILRGLPPVEQRWLQIDSGAGTPLTRFDGDPQSLDFLRYDISSFAHHLRPGGEVFLIGPGGGRDVLTAIAFQAKRIEAVEVNPAILAAVHGQFGDFTGHLDRMPGIHFAADEGRSRLARETGQFDIVQASFVDTVAATAAGAYAFIENGLYTVEGWQLFLEHVKPGGVLTFSRFYYGSTVWPVEVYRLMALARAALEAQGITEPERHVLLVRTRGLDQPGLHEGIVTLMVSPSPFPTDDLERAEQICAEIRCEVAYSWRGTVDSTLDGLMRAARPEEVWARLPLDISPPTDDRPYFFFHARVGDILGGREGPAWGGSSFNLPAIRLLLTLTCLVMGLATALVLLPLPWLRRRGGWRPSAAGGAAAPAYFAAIGMAFLFVEIGLIQRLSLFLGHPTFGFTVVLAGLLLGGGAGSLASSVAARVIAPPREWWGVALLVPLVLATELGTRLALESAHGWPATARSVLALALLAPPAFGMGFAFPLGMAAVHRRGDPRGAWYWAINGALSVVASVLGMLVSMVWGIRVTLWAGAAFYFCAALLLRALRLPIAANPPRPQLADDTGGA